MVAGSHVGQHHAARRAGSDCRRGEHVVQPPADVSSAKVAPRCPPGEEAGVIRIEGAPEVHELVAQQGLEL